MLRRQAKVVKCSIEICPVVFVSFLGGCGPTPGHGEEKGISAADVSPAEISKGCTSS